jgi:hypothetical protein
MAITTDQEKYAVLYLNNWMVPQLPIELLGPQLIVGGDMNDASDWTAGTGWTVNGGGSSKAVAVAATGNLSQSLASTLVSGQTYEITFTMSNYQPSGAARLLLSGGGGNAIGSSRNADGTYTEQVVATGNHTTFWIRTVVDPSDYDIDDISMRVLLDIGLAHKKLFIHGYPTITWADPPEAANDFQWITRYRRRGKR